MTTKLKQCKACDDQFHWNDNIIIVNDKFYHKECVSLFPTGYVAFIDDEFLGETDNEDGQIAFEVLEDDEYLEVTEC